MRFIALSHQKKPADSRAMHGFTLIELLTVIAIIGILAAIIIPVVGKVRESSRTAQCLSNLRQCFTIYMLNVNDDKGRIPMANAGEFGTTQTGQPGGGLYWIDYISTTFQASEIRKGMGSVLGCPVQLAKKPKITEKLLAQNAAPRTYSLNADLNRTPLPDYKPVKKQLNSIPNPSRTVIIGDGNDNGTDNSYDAIMRYTKGPDRIHSGKANVLYLDGHVKTLSDAELLELEKPSKSTDAAIFWFGE